MITITGNIATIKSQIPYDLIDKATKLNSELLTVRDQDQDDKPIKFFVMNNPGTFGSASSKGISYNAKSVQDGKAICTLELPKDLQDTKTFVRETFGASILAAAVNEPLIISNIEDLATQLASIEIEVL